MLKEGVIELMPIWDDQYYSFKYVNGHPNNPLSDKQTVVSIGMLTDVQSGYPLLISEMTLLTALRTAATSALASDLMANPNANTIALIGTGVQSECQILAHQLIRPIQTVRYYDPKPQAMQRFANNMQHKNIKLIPCQHIQDTLDGAHLIISATAAKEHACILKKAWIKAGMHLNAIGGDCPGKTELDPNILKNSRIAVEFFPQSFIEGEIQQLSESEAKQYVCAELWELVQEKKSARLDPNDITVFDSVGFALEDYTILRLVYDLAQHYSIGIPSNLIPKLDDPSDLYSLLRKP